MSPHYIILDGTSNWVEIVTAFSTLFAVVIAIFLPEVQKYFDYKRAKKSLEIELKYNFKQLFTTEIERPLLFNSYNYFSLNHIYRVTDKNSFGYLQSIYSHLRYYDRFIKSFYLSDPLYGKHSTEKQLQTYNRILIMFKISMVEYNFDKLKSEDGLSYIQKLRDTQIRNYEENKDAITLEITELIRRL